MILDLGSSASQQERQQKLFPEKLLFRSMTWIMQS